MGSSGFTNPVAILGTVIIVIGVVMLIAGVILAVYLKKRQRKIMHFQHPPASRSRRMLML